MSWVARSARRAVIAAVVVAAVLVQHPASSTAATRTRRRSTGAKYVVVLHDDANSDAVAQDHIRRYHAHVSYVYRRAIHGYAAKLSADAVRAIAADPSVERVDPDVRVRERDVPWGLDRIDQADLPLDHHYAAAGNGAGVTVYVIDTGIRFTHRDFGGRAVSGFDAVNGGPATDCNGHGTHVAGTIGGAAHGVAPAVRLVAVRVLNCSGSGAVSEVIAGIDWVTTDHKPGQPAVANMSLGGGVSAALDKAVARSVADGVAYSVAAGNDGTDACTSSPARVPGVMTVAASDRTDHPASWSDRGPCVDWYAPGVSIASDWDTSDTAIKTISGTSMAAPHTAGVAAVYLGRHPGASPAALQAALAALAVPRIVGAPPGTAPRLLQVRGA